MTHRRLSFTAIGCALGIGFYAAVLAAATGTPHLSITMGSSRVSLAGTSNIHAFNASTTEVRVVRFQLADGVLAGANLWEEIVKPGAIQALEIGIRAATLSSPREGLDKNMHKALKVTDHPDITFRLSRLEGAGSSSVLKAVGILQIAGVEREVTLDLKTQRTDAGLTVKGEVSLLMTDFGITPPKAMLGMLKTDPKVTVTFETVLAIPLT
jgi:hypothetical protein